MQDITWFDVDYNNFDNTINEVKDYINREVLNEK